MSIGAIEIGLVVVATAGTVFAVRWTRQAWLAVLPLFFVVAAVVSPADAVSTLLVGVPNCLLFAVAFRYFAARREPELAGD